MRRIGFALATLVFGLLGAIAPATAQLLPQLTQPQFGVDRLTHPNGPWPLYHRGLNGVQVPIGTLDPVAGTYSLPPLGSFVMKGGTPSIVNLYSSLPANYAGLSGAGSIFSMGCLDVGCPAINGVPYDSQRSQFFIHTTSQADATKQEYAAYLHMDANTGKATFWGATLPYAVGVQVVNAGNVYTQTGTSGCTSGSSGGPTQSSGTSSTDGTCTWSFGGVNTDGKTALGVSIYSGPNSGAAWGVAINHYRVAGGNNARFTAGQEIDNYIGDGDHPIGTATGDAYSLIQSGFSPVGSIGTVAHAISTVNTADYAWHCGVCLISPWAAKDEGFGNASNSTIGYLNNAAANAGPGFQDSAGTRVIGFNAAAYYSVAAIDTTAARNSNNTATVPIALRLLAGQKICFSTNDLCLLASGADLFFSNGGNNFFGIDGLANLSVLGAVRSITATPTVACPGAASATITGNAQSGVVTVGAGTVTSCTITLVAALPAPFAGCTLTPANATAAGSGVGAFAALSDRTTTSWKITGTALAGAAFNYVCM